MDRQKLKSHQPRLRVVAWKKIRLLDPVSQAQIPARSLDLLIRMQGIVETACIDGKRLALEAYKCMALFEVKQRVL